MARKIAIVCLLSAFLIGSFAYQHTLDHKIALARIKRYAKREVTGSCFYNMCNETEGYPLEEIRQMVEQRQEYHDLFGTVVAPHKPIDLASRFRQMGQEENMCESQSFYMLPQKAIDSDGVWQTIVNAGGKYQQIVNFEACAQEASCIAENFIPDRKAVCAQNEVLLKMLSFDADQAIDDKSLKMSLFKIPSGCACMHKEVYNYYGAQCYAQEHLTIGYQTACAMQEIVLRMVVFNPNGDLKMAQFPLPAGCYCKYRFDRSELL